MKIVFWGSSDFSIYSLEALYSRHSILAVVTNPDAFCGRGMKELKLTPVKEFALKRSVEVLQPENLRDEAFQKKLFSFNADIYVVVSYGKIIPENIIYHPEYKTINLHASLLPKYRGASPIHNALINGDKITGNSVQFIKKELDKGDIILQSKIEINDSDTFLELSERLARDGAELLLKAIDLIEKGNYKTFPQDDKLASYTHVIKKEDGLIDFINMTAGEIYNRWRAFKLWPEIFAFYSNSRGEKFSGGIKTILKEIRPVQTDGDAGKIMKADRTGFIVSCKQGGIQIERIKPENRKEIDYISYQWL